MNLAPNTFGKVLIGLIFLATLTHCTKSKNQPTKQPTTGQQYPAPWRSDNNTELTKLLIQKDIRGCGDMKYREHIYNKGEYLIHCSIDGQHWISYIGWPKTDNIQGPFKSEYLQD